MEHIIEMKNITKTFPGVIANNNVNFELRKNEIHVLLGENGAGKTTLMNVLYGLYKPTSGEILVNGKKTEITNPNIAIENGIGMVHQHFMLVKPFTVTENIILGSETKKGISLDIKKARRDVLEISKRYGLSVDPDSKISDITVGMQQRVEILKILYRGSEILILDEPTAVLTPQEIDELAVILENLKKQGKSIILITHKLKEVMKMSDRVTVVRRGKVIATVNTSETNSDDLAEMMVGRKVKFEVDKGKYKPGEIVLKVDNIKVYDNRGVEALKGISLDVKRGEIFAIAGVDGNGQAELVETITGLRKAKKGKIFFKGLDITGYKTKKIIEMGIGHIPADRQKRGLVLDYNLSDNMILGTHYKKPFTKHFILNKKAISENGKKLINEYDVRTSNEKVLAKTLSGGNQQKVILAREFSRDPEFLIASQPTRGLDIGAIEFVHSKLVEMRDKGKGVLLVSFELSEVLSLADRIGVIFDGALVAVLEAKEADEKTLGILMAGGSIKKKEGK